MGLFKPNVEKIKAKGDVDGLIGALKHKNKDVRWDACKALGSLAPEAKAAIPALTKALKDEDEDIRTVAVESLEKIEAVGRMRGSSLEKILREMGFPKKDIAYVPSFSPLLFTKLAQLADELVCREQNRATKLGQMKIELSPWAHGQVTEMLNVMLEIVGCIHPLDAIDKKGEALYKFLDVVIRDRMLAHAYLVKAVEEVVKKASKKRKSKK